MAVGTYGDLRVVAFEVQFLAFVVPLIEEKLPRLASGGGWGLTHWHS